MALNEIEGRIGYVVIIPTCNRPEYLKRILEYYEGFSQKFKIIVGDSSSDKNKSTNEKNIELLCNLDITYLSYPADIDPLSKFLCMLNHAGEKYCVFCADDDFIIPNAIRQAINFLEKNLDYSTAHGHYIRFHMYTSTYRDKTHRYFSWQPFDAYIAPSWIDNDPIVRITQHLAKYVPTFYATHRTDELLLNLKKTVEYMNKYRNEYSPFYEILPSFLSIIQGKTKRLDMFYGARESIKNSRGQTFPQWHAIVLQQDFWEKYVDFRSCLIENLKVTIDGKAYSQVEKTINRAFSFFLRCRFNAEGFGPHARNNSETTTRKERIKKKLANYGLLRFAKDANSIFGRFKFTIRILRWIIVDRKEKLPFLWWLNIYRQHKDISAIKKKVIDGKYFDDKG